MKALNTFSFYAQQWGWQSDQGYNQREIDETKANFDASYAVLEKLLAVSRPSAARELALERISKILRGDVETDTIVTAVNRLNAAIDIAIRALSSPDHNADAGKVEGDGWLPIESAPKDGTPVLIAWQAVASFRGEKQWFQTVAHYDDSFEIAGYDEETGDAHKRGAWTDGAVASWAYEEIREISPTHWRPLPSAPSEGAE
ncbi:DUF551 domain-containing protein [Brucella intermedia]|uniref:DUF551 domain-containing protein n=1 Tax=Brucella intermedia TaxID=94625 RepID=UPI00224B934E|nr:DUF551 domain-containing protein [Brucella intermedia]